MALLHEEDNHNHEDKLYNKAQREGTHQNLKKHIPYSYNSLSKIRKVHG